MPYWSNRANKLIYMDFLKYSVTGVRTDIRQLTKSHVEFSRVASLVVSSVTGSPEQATPGIEQAGTMALESCRGVQRPQLESGQWNYA